MSRQLFQALNEFADRCRDKFGRHNTNSIPVHTTTGTGIENSIRDLRLPLFTFNKLVRELAKSHTYGYKCAGEGRDGDKRWRSFQVTNKA